MKAIEKGRPDSLFLRSVFSLCLAFCPAPAFSQDSIPAEKDARLEFHGYVKNMQSALFTDQSGSLVTGNLVHARANLKWEIARDLYLRAESRNRVLYGEQVKQIKDFGKYLDADNGLVDLSYNVVDDTALVFNTTLDRLLLNWSDSKWDVTVGRQRINWGVNLVWNPNDIFNVFNYLDFDYEERPGSDALRIQHFRGKSAFELAYKLSDRKKEQTGALMHKVNFRKYDIQNLAGIYFQDIVIGTGWAGAIKNTGFKGEASYFHPYRNIADTSGVLSASLSFDRSFKMNYFAMVSYLYNSRGKGTLKSMGELTGTVLSAKKLMPFGHTFFVQAGKSFSPLVSASMAFIYSPMNNTLIVLPFLTVSVADDWELALVGQSFFSQVNGSYRTLGNGIFIRLRWSF